MRLYSWILYIFYFDNVNPAKSEFVDLDVLGKTYLPWTPDAEIYLNVVNLGQTIKEGNEIHFI
jgi:hypothetical protein